MTPSHCAEGIAEPSFRCLAHILQPIHGLVEDNCAYVLRKLMPGMLGLSESSADGKHNNFQRSAHVIRADSIAFAAQCCRYAGSLTFVPVSSSSTGQAGCKFFCPLSISGLTYRSCCA